MTQSEPKVIDADDMPAFTGSDRGLVITDFVTEANADEQGFTIQASSTATPKGMHRQLLTNAQEHAEHAAEDAYTACDWLSLLDAPLSDRYRRSARSLYELSEHVAALLEEL